MTVVFEHHVFDGIIFVHEAAGTRFTEVGPDPVAEETHVLVASCWCLEMSLAGVTFVGLHGCSEITGRGEED